MTDDQNPQDEAGTDPGMTYAEWKTGGVPKRDAASEKERADVRAVLAAAVAGAPEPPSVDAIAARIAAAPGSVGSASPAGAAASARAPLASGDGAAGDDDVADYVPLTGSSGGGTRPGSRWQRVALAAAAILAVVAVGAVVLGNRDEPKDGVFTEQPDGAPAEADQALAMVPAELPAGLVPVWVSSGVSDEGDRFAAVHYASPEVGGDGLPVGSRLKVESVVVDPAEVDLVADARESGSLELWDGREVVVTDDGATAQFVDPAGVQVLVQGDPTVVRDVVPTLRVLSGADWALFLDDLDTEVEALPMVAAFELIPNELGEGELTLTEETTDDTTVRISVHGDPEAVDADAAPTGGEGGSGVVAGTCLTVDDVTACRPGHFLSFGVPGGVDSSYDVLIDGNWWHFGWSTNELTGVTVATEPGVEAGVRWAFEGTGHGDSMSWYASVLPADATQIQVELTSAGGAGSAFNSLRPAH